MGVRYLLTHVQKEVEGGYVKVDIFEVISQWKRINGLSPIIVFDVMSFVSFGTSNKRDTLLGGRHQMIEKLYHQLFQKLKNHGATLAFFMDGTYNGKLNVRIKRHARRYNETIEMFDAINQGASLDEVIKYQSNHVQQITTFVEVLINLAKKFGIFKTTHHHDCDVEIAQYATNNNALAIFTDDTDFLIYEGSWRLWCVDKLDVNSGQGMELSRPALLQHLDLSAEQMPLFATLAGNDVVEYDRIKIFLSSFGPIHKRFLNLAKFIRKMNKLPMHLNDLDLSDLANRLFYNSSIENIELIRKSIKSYDLNFEILNSNDESNELLKKCANNSTIYSILTDVSDIIRLSYFDLREPEFIPYIDLILPIIRRYHGILLNDQKANNPIRLVYSKKYHSESLLEFTIEPDYPKINVPPLIFDENNKSQSLYNIRWNLLFWCIYGDSPDRPNLSNIPNHIYCCTLLTLIYLRMTNQINVYEADAMLLSVNDVKNNLVPEMVRYPVYVTTRSIMLSHLFTKVYEKVIHSFRICGLKQCTEKLIFDGVYFCSLLISMEMDDHDNYSAALERISEYRKIYLNITN